jgi:hypothetical protein
MKLGTSEELQMKQLFMIVQIFLFDTKTSSYTLYFYFKRLAKKNNLNILIYIFVFYHIPHFLDIVVILIIIRVRKTYCLRGSSPKLAQLQSLRWCWWRVIDTHLLEEVEEAFIRLCPLFTHLPKRVARALLPLCMLM